MRRWGDWEVVRHQVVLAGLVEEEATGTPVAGAEVSVAVTGEADRADGGPSHADGTFTKADGIYFFLDLPAGRYRVTAVELRSGARDEKTVSIPRDRQGNVQLTSVDINLSQPPQASRRGRGAG
jgi:hypothetical protein